MRRPEGGRRDGVLDVTRGVAAVMVLSCHTQAADAASRPVTRWLWLQPNVVSVTVFFILSGYLIGGPWLRGLTGEAPFPDTRDYVRRRVLRVLPGYWLAVVIAYLLQTPGTRVSAGVLLAHLFFVQIYLPGQWTALLLVSWTLSVEVAFYLVLPVVMLLVRRRTRGRALDPRAVIRWLLALTVADVFANIAFVGYLPDLPRSFAGTVLQTPPVYAGAFTLGMLLTVAPRLPARIGAGPALIAGLLSWELCTQLTRTVHTHLWARPLLVLPCWLFVVSALGLGQLGPAARRVVTVLTPLGTYSYGIYLFHLPVLAALGRFDPALRDSLQPAGSWPLRIVVLLAVTLPPAMVSWYLLESPALRWAVRRGETERAQATARWRAGGRPVSATGPGVQRV